MHVTCALRPNIKSNEEIIQHFTHWHPLKLVDEKDLQVGCGICEKLICFDSASSAAYGCKECNFFAHKSCMMNIPRQMNHSFHPSCPLILQTTPFYFKCKGCDGGSNSQLVYRCGKCKFDLDFKCALLPTLDQSKDADQIQYVGHKHPLLALHDNNNKHHNVIKFGSEVRCSVCEEKCSLDEEDPCFGCERCQYFIHKQCVAVDFRPEIHHHFHPLHPLILSSIPPDEGAFHCSACGGSIDEFLLVYGCAKCRFYLHADCAMPKLLVKYEGHSHHLTFIDKTCAPLWCQICLDPTRNCFFGCVACDFYIHLHCHPSTPKTIRHNSHLHPLTLRRSPFKFERISPEYWEESDRFNEVFYCDVCEEKRYKLESVYYCSECKFIAETRCIISEVLFSIQFCIYEAKFAFNSQESQLLFYFVYKLLPSVTGSEGHHAMDKNSALEASIAKRSNEIAQLRAEQRPLTLEIEKLEATLQALKVKDKAITRELREFEIDRFMWNYELNHNLKDKKKATEASTSKGLPADTLS
ncbi:DC1 domain-containing protein [Corchorus olitorius]|uniref:DC1 domain-containing protein n=1 Tax=Corchorus olitorius TaxID=93759 RepID=A0A1R3KSV0_9ROSI|nr:DC1 domain-containing protein [Corchorus olitorius]